MTKHWSFNEAEHFYGIFLFFFLNIAPVEPWPFLNPLLCLETSWCVHYCPLLNKTHPFHKNNPAPTLHKLPAGRSVTSRTFTYFFPETKWLHLWFFEHPMNASRQTSNSPSIVHVEVWGLKKKRRKKSCTQ